MSKKIDVFKNIILITYFIIVELRTIQIEKLNQQLSQVEFFLGLSHLEEVDGH